MKVKNLEYILSQCQPDANVVLSVEFNKNEMTERMAQGETHIMGDCHLTTDDNGDYVILTATTAHEDNTETPWPFANISPEVATYADSKGLDYIGTGGGFDYVIKTFGPECPETHTGQALELVLGNANDGCHPTSLDGVATVSLYYKNEGWWAETTDEYEYGIIDFETTREAIDFMAGVSEAIALGFLGDND